MPGIEFVGTDAGGDAGGDVLDTGPRRPWPRWVWLVVGLLVVAVVVGVLVSAHSDDAAPTATDSTPPTTATTSAPSAPSGPRITTLASDGTSLFWLAGGRLFRAGPVGRPSVSTAISFTGGDAAGLQLVPDPDERTIWVVSHGSTDSAGRPGGAEAFATADLSRSTQAQARSPINGAAVLNGALYVLASGRLLRLTAGESRFVTMASVDVRAHGLVTAADRLLYVEGDNGSAVGQWTPSGVREPSVLGTVDDTLAVAGSTVFVLGTTKDQQSELDTFSPLRRTVDQQALATGLDDPLQLVAAGPRSVIVQGTGRRGDELACVTTADQVDAPGPATVQALAVATSQAVAELGSQVFQADGDTVRPVTFNVGRCST